MPLIFATGAATASGITYDDVFGLQYEFPAQYADMVVPGEVFVYYTGKRSAEYRRSVYLGVGIVGEIRESRKPDHLVAEVHDVELFGEPVSIKDANGNYFETGSTKRTNWPNGVRRVSDGVLQAILAQAEGRLTPTTSAGAATPLRGRTSPEHAARLERYSVGVAIGLLEGEFGTASVEEMPPGNPGYDLRVMAGGDELHVEVKGTILSEPVFHLSEGQRRHAESMGDRFRLIVVYAVSLAARTHEIAIVDGPLESSTELVPDAWTGRVRALTIGAEAEQQLV